MRKEINVTRSLIAAATYRKFAFESEESLQTWLDKGGRWLVTKTNCDGTIIAIVGEVYNMTMPLYANPDGFTKKENM